MAGLVAGLGAGGLQQPQHSLHEGGRKKGQRSIWLRSQKKSIKLLKLS